MFRYFLFTLLLFSFNLAFSQFPQDYHVGHLVDIEGNAIHNYIDFDYQPSGSLALTITAGNDDMPGYFVNNKGNKIIGYIQFNDRLNAIYFKKDVDVYEREKLKPDDFRCFVMGTDSFISISNYVEVNNKPQDKPIFVRYMDEIDGFRFYEHLKIDLQGQIFISYYYQKEDGIITKLSSYSRTILDQLGPLFERLPYLRQKIEDKTYKKADLPAIIEFLKHKKCFDEKGRIYFDSNWNEIANKSMALYYAMVDSVEDLSFYLSYYNKAGLKIYEGKVTSFYPHQREGDYTFYDLNGKKRKVISYDNNNWEKTFIYHPNGIVQYAIKPKDGKDYYRYVFKPNETPLLNGTGYGSDVVFDSLNQRKVYRSFENYRLVNSYYLEGNEKVFQLCDKNVKIKNFNRTKKQINEYETYPDKCVLDNVQGIVLAKLIIDKDGNMRTLEIIKGLSREADNYVKGVFEDLNRSSHFKPAKHGNVFVKQEVVIPFVFSINKPSSRNLYNYNWMHHHMNTPYTPVPPSPPRF